MRALGGSLALAFVPLRSVSWIASAETASTLPRSRAGEPPLWAKAPPARESPTASTNSLRLSIVCLLLFVQSEESGSLRSGKSHTLGHHLLPSVEAVMEVAAAEKTMTETRPDRSEEAQGCDRKACT